MASRLYRVRTDKATMDWRIYRASSALYALEQELERLKRHGVVMEPDSLCVEYLGSLEN